MFEGEKIRDEKEIKILSNGTCKESNDEVRTSCYPNRPQIACNTILRFAIVVMDATEK